MLLKLYILGVFLCEIWNHNRYGYVALEKYLIELLPIPRPSAEVENEFNSALDNLLSAIMPEDIENCTRHINHLVYSTIGLTNQEIETVERIVAEGAH